MAKRAKKPSKADQEARINDLFELRRKRATFWRIREFVREEEKREGSPWFVEPGEEPISDDSLRRNLTVVNKLTDALVKKKRKRLLYDHLADRDFLYSEAVLAGDLRAALSTLQDTANLLNLYPSRRLKIKMRVATTVAFVEVMPNASDADDRGSDAGDGPPEAEGPALPFPSGTDEGVA